MSICKVKFNQAAGDWHWTYTWSKNEKKKRRNFL